LHLTGSALRFSETSRSLQPARQVNAVVSRPEGSLMIENNPTSVVAAFEMLLEEIEAEIDFVNRIGVRAFEGRDYEKAKEALERAAQVTGFRD